MHQSQIPVADKARGTRPLQSIKPSMQPTYTTDGTQSTAMVTTSISTIAAGVLTFFIWTDGCFFEIPMSSTAFLPGPLTMLAIFWLHIVPVILVAKRDGEGLRAARLL
jgi:hypothetical protein